MPPSERLVASLNEQVAREFAAAHQYVAIGAYYDAETFPQLAKFCAKIDRHRLDSTAIRRELGWEPRWGLEEGLASTWSWYRESV